MNVIFTAPKLSKAEQQSPSDIQMACLRIGPEVSFRMAHSQRSLRTFHSIYRIQDALFEGLEGLRCTDGNFNAAYKSVINPADALVENGSLRNQVTKRYWVCLMSVMYCSGELRGSSGRSEDYLEGLDARRSS
jgi:hypothetical protein